MPDIPWKVINGHQVHAPVLFLSQKERAPRRVLRGLKGYFVFLHEGIPDLLRNSSSQVQRPFVAGKLYLCHTGSIIAVEKSSQGCFVYF